MGIFGKKKANEFDSLHNENLFNDDDDIIVPAGQRRAGMHSVGHGNVYAPHALTADEVSEARPAENIPMEHVQPNSVYKRMKEREQNTAETGIDDNYVPSWAVTAASAKADTDGEILSQSQKTADFEGVSKPSAPDTAKSYKSPAPAPTPAPQYSAASAAFLERCRSAVESASGDSLPKTNVNISMSSEPPRDTADYLRPADPNKFTAANSNPTTRSVDEILNMLRGNTEAPNEPQEPTASPDSQAPQTPDTPDFNESKPTVAEQPKEIKVEVEEIPTDSDSDIMHTTVSRSAPESDVRIYGKVVRGTVLQHTPDGDIELSQLINAKKPEPDAVTAEEKTIMLGELGDIISKRADDDFKAVKASDGDSYYDDDDDDESYGYEERPYYETEDPLLADTDDYKDLNDAARLRLKLASEKSKHKTLSAFTCIATVLMLIIATPLTKALTDTTVAMIDLILLTAALLVNIDIFLDFKNLFKMRPRFDSCVAVASALTLVQSAVSAFMYGGKYSGLSAAAAILLSVNRISHLLKSSRILRGLELIANSEVKRASLSVSGSNAKTIASGAAEEAVVLCGRETVNVKDYLKNCGYDSPFDRKTKALFITSVVISVVAGFVAGYFGGLGLGLSACAALLCCMFPACAAFVCELPMYLASKKAARYGGMLAGFKGAYELDLANFVAVNSSDLFPAGTVKLYNMKALGENEIGKTLIDAGAVAQAADSPLSNIFNEIIGSDAEKSYPKVNGVQYEDKMGISGWIGERTILIGNRNLMQGHNIPAPSASVDQKILRAGYFPVYIAVDSVPCLLFVVKYDVDPAIAHELRVLCNTGMTVVVDPKDPNTSSAMLCDYFGMPDDALKVMNHNGRTTYERTAAPVESASAPASFGKDICGFFSAVSSSTKLRGIYSLLTALFVIASALGTFLLIYLCVTAKLSLLTSLTVGGFQLIFTAVSALIAKARLK